MESGIILLVESNGEDSLLIARAFKRANILNELRVVSHAQQAVDYLSRLGAQSNQPANPLPELILLDLKMPGIDGLELLSWIRAQPSLAGIRVVVLTSSVDVRCVNQAIELGADGFMLKPEDFLRLVEFTEALAGCWLWKMQEAQLPVCSMASLKAAN